MLNVQKKRKHPGQARKNKYYNRIYEEEEKTIGKWYKVVELVD